MMRTALLLVGAVCFAPAIGGAATPLSFKDAQIGMTVGEWRSLAPPEGAGPDALAACSNDPRVEAVGASRMSATETASGVVSCSYVSRFGDTVLMRSVELDARYRASDVAYLFDHDRLSEIRFTAPIDAFNDVMAMLQHHYGPPTVTQRDQIQTMDGRFARVSQTWRVPGGAIKLVDPAGGLTQLEVSMVGPGGDRAIQAVASMSSAPER